MSPDPDLTEEFNALFDAEPPLRATPEQVLAAVRGLRRRRQRIAVAGSAIGTVVLVGATAAAAAGLSGGPAPDRTADGNGGAAHTDDELHSADRGAAPAAAGRRAGPGVGVRRGHRSRLCGRRTARRAPRPADTHGAAGRESERHPGAAGSEPGHPDHAGRRAERCPVRASPAERLASRVPTAEPPRATAVPTPSAAPPATALPRSTEPPARAVPRDVGRRRRSRVHRGADPAAIGG